MARLERPDGAPPTQNKEDLLQDGEGEFSRRSNGNLECLYGPNPDDTEAQCREWEERERLRLLLYGR